MRCVLALALLALVGCDHAAHDYAEAVTGGDVERGRTAIATYGCVSCHEIPGIRGANGTVGPPLNRMASRTYIAGVIQNTPENMQAWLIDPPSIDPQTAMPKVHVTAADARDIAAYLLTLQ